MLLHQNIASSLFTTTPWSINIHITAMRHKLVLPAYKYLENIPNTSIPMSSYRILLLLASAAVFADYIKTHKLEEVFNMKHSTDS